MKSGVRISSGELKGTRLTVPGGVRPTSQMVREAVFSRWQTRLPESRFLDLFAGSGAVGLEAASRGASRVVCVEGTPRVARQLIEVCRRWAPEAVSVARALLPDEAGRVDAAPGFDLIFADPPYAFDLYVELLEVIGERLLSDGEAAVEHASRVDLPERTERLERTSVRRYGDSCLSFYSRDSALTRAS